jgi:hypothetical protein
MKSKADVQEQIKYETELLRLSLLAAVAAIGGVVGLLLGEATVLRAGLAGAGVLAIVVLVGVALHQDRRIRRLLRQMEDL